MCTCMLPTEAGESSDHFGCFSKFEISQFHDLTSFPVSIDGRDFHSLSSATKLMIAFVFQRKLLVICIFIIGLIAIVTTIAVLAYVATH